MKEGWGGFWFGLRKIEKVVFEGFGGVEGRLRVKFYELFLRIGYYMVMKF